MDEADDDGGGSDGDVLVQPSFNDRLNINDFPVVSSGSEDVASTATTSASASPAAVSLHTPTPPNVGDCDETQSQFSFKLATSSSTHYELHRSPTITTGSEYNSNCSVAYSFITALHDCSPLFAVPIYVSTLHSPRSTLIDRYFWFYKLL